MNNDIVKKPYEETIYEDKEARRYPNGVIRSPQGYILYTPPEYMHALRVQKKARAEERAQEGIKLATQSESSEEAVMKIIRARTNIAMTDPGRAGNDAAKLVLSAAGFLRSERSVEVHGRVSHVPEPPQLSPKYLEYLEKLANRDVIEGKLVEEE